MALRQYLATEVALDHAEGHLTRREALRKLGLLGLSAVVASGLLAACSTGTPPVPPAAAPADPGYDVPAARARTAPVTYAGAAGELQGAYAAPTVAPAATTTYDDRVLAWLRQHLV